MTEWQSTSSCGKIDFKRIRESILAKRSLSQTKGDELTSIIAVLYYVACVGSSSRERAEAV